MNLPTASFNYPSNIHSSNAFLDTTNNKLYIAMSNLAFGQSALVIIDTSTNTIANTITIPIEFVQAGIAIDTTNNIAYISANNSAGDSFDNRLIALNITSSISNGNNGVISKSMSIGTSRTCLLYTNNKLVLGGYYNATFGVYTDSIGIYYT
jgi:hypothetical protein